MAIIRGHTEANCFFNCGVTLGLKPLASFSNSALVITVLQSVAGLFSPVDFAAVAGFAAAGLGCGEHTPLTVMTAAAGGTAAELSAGVWVGWGGAGLPGMACPHASVPNRTHINPLLRII
jgi:hypothetical protein